MLSFEALKKQVNLDHLRCFVACAETKSFSQAAKTLGSTQPAVSKKMESLEKMLGGRGSLFDRSNQGVTLTGDGRQLYERVTVALRAVDRTLEYAKNSANADEGYLSIACYPVHIERILGAALGQLHREHPRVKIDLTQMRDDRRRQWGRNLLDEVEDGQVELAIGPDANRKDLRRQLLYRTSIVALVPDDHPGRYQEQLPVADLRSEPILIAPEQFFSRERVATIAREAGFELDVVVESSTASALLALGRAGIGIPILPDDYPLVGQHPDAYPALIDNAGNAVCTDVFIYWRDNQLPSAVATSLLKILEGYTQEETQNGKRRKQSYYNPDLIPD